MGYDSESPAYFVYSPNNNTVQKIRCVKFSEEFKEKVKTPIIVYEQDYAQEEQETKSQTEELKDENASDQQQPRYLTRRRMKPKHLQDYVCEGDQSISAKFFVDYCYSASIAPETYKEAISTPECGKWKKAMEEEIQALEESGTYDLTTLPKGCNVVGGRWVYAVQPGPNNTETTFKAHYVAKGFLQVKDVDYQETFSPTAKVTSMRMLMQVAAEES